MKVDILKPIIIDSQNTNISLESIDICKSLSGLNQSY